jgi:hypothetical protein
MAPPECLTANFFVESAFLRLRLFGLYDGTIDRGLSSSVRMLTYRTNGFEPEEFLLEGGFSVFLARAPDRL